MENINKFIKDQLSVWPLAASNFRALKTMEVRKLEVGGLECRIQHNPSRIQSSTAEISAEYLASRPCFLCVEHRQPEQFHLPFDGRKGRKYHIQVNPYPIFPKHLVIARDEHIPQVIWHHMPDMLDFAKKYKDYTVYYNGPYSGASAPDHLHFQACLRKTLPLENAVDAFLDCAQEPLATVKDAKLFHFCHYTRGVYVMKSTTTKSVTKLFYQMLDCVPAMDEGAEPRFNLYCWTKGEEYRVMAVLRTEIRSHHYDATGEEHLTISPGAAEMAGVFVAPHHDDYLKADTRMLEEMLAEVSVSKDTEELIDWRLSRQQRKINVTIARAKAISFEIISDGAGRQTVSFRDGRIDYNGVLYDELYFDSVTRSTLFAKPSFIIYDAKSFTRYAGALKFAVDGDNVVAVNRIGVENYLLGIISNVNADLPAEALRRRTELYRLLGDGDTLDAGAQNYCGCPTEYAEAAKNAIESTWDKTIV